MRLKALAEIYTMHSSFNLPPDTAVWDPPSFFNLKKLREALVVGCIEADFAN